MKHDQALGFIEYVAYDDVFFQDTRFFILINQSKLQWYREDTINYIQYLKHMTRCKNIYQNYKINHKSIKVVSSNPVHDGVLDTTLCDKVCQWLATGRWLSLGTPVSSTNKTDRHDIVEVAFSTINQIKP